MAIKALGTGPAGRDGRRQRCGQHRCVLASTQAAEQSVGIDADLKTAVITIALALVVSTLNVLAQDLSGTPTSGGKSWGQGGQHQRPTPEQMAARLKNTDSICENIL